MSTGLQTCAGPKCQQGAALIVAVVLFALIGVTAVLAVKPRIDSQAEKERRTTEALAQAKAALIGFAAGLSLNGPERPGDLPCPDLDNDGSAELSCSTAAERLGRLPWKTLGLPDLRDGDGERLWYAVSTNFKNNPRTLCAGHADAGCLNSDARGTITFRDTSGSVVYDGAAQGAIAVVIAPGAVLRRDDSPINPQTRDAVGINVPVNYLDIQPGGGEDNAIFTDSSANGFIAGPIVDASGRVLVNDSIATITYQDLMPVLERRVAQEVALCLRDYALANGQKYPWAADMDRSSILPPQYHDYEAPGPRRYGRIPDEPFTRTRTDDTLMLPNWTATCRLPVVGAGGERWWTNWKAQVLYAIAEAFQPGGPALCGTCLTVNLPSGGTATNVRFVVMVAGRALAGQDRSAPPGWVNSNPANFVEFENATVPITPDPTFEIRALSATFNDRLAYF